MRSFSRSTMVALSLCALGLSACGKAEVKTGSLTQHFSMVDSDGRVFGAVELDPVNGGTLSDAQGRLVGRIVPPSGTAVVAATQIPGVAQ